MLVRRAAHFLVGRVLEGGLGLGIARRELCARHRFVETVEVNARVVAYWRARREGIEESPEDADKTITRDDIRTVLAQKAQMRRTDRPHSMLLHIPPDLLSDGDLIANAGATFDRLGQRMVLVISGQTSGRVEVPGWRIGMIHYTREGSLQVMDRWDPSQGLGSSRTPRPTGQAHLDIGG